MYVYDCNAILTTAMKNISDKDMIRAFTSLTEYLKSQGFNPGFNFMDNEASTALNTTMTSINIKYQLVTPSNHISKNAERVIQKSNIHFIAGLCSVENDFHIKLWEKSLHNATISINLIRQSRNLTHISAYTHIFREFDFNCTPDRVQDSYEEQEF